MKKGLVIFVVIVVLLAGVVWKVLDGAGGFIKAQIEQQGSQYLGTSVSVASVSLALTEGQMSINDLDIKNPQGFSQEDAFSIDAISLDLGKITKEPYVIQTININAPEMLYELDKSRKGNLLVLKDNLMNQLPASQQQSSESEGANPLIIVENVVVNNVRLKLNFENMDTGDLKIK